MKLVVTKGHSPVTNTYLQVFLQSRSASPFKYVFLLLWIEGADASVCTQIYCGGAGPDNNSSYKIYHFASRRQSSAPYSQSGTIRTDPWLWLYGYACTNTNCCAQIPSFFPLETHSSMKGKYSTLERAILCRAIKSEILAIILILRRYCLVKSGERRMIILLANWKICFIGTLLCKPSYCGYTISTDIYRCSSSIWLVSLKPQQQLLTSTRAR